MKKDFFDYMLILMRGNPDIYLIFAGLGWPRLEEFQKEFPDRAFNVEASEQTALDISVGLAYSGKIPFVYTITPFLLRGFETIRTYIDHEKLNVKLVGAGRDDDYAKHDGFSHDASDIGRIFDTLPNLFQYYPDSIEQMKEYLEMMVKLDKPQFISIPK